MRRYPKELKAKARELVRNGLSKTGASEKLGVQYQTVLDWTRFIRRRKRYPIHMKEKVRKLTRAGLSKIEVSEATGVGYGTVIQWTAGIGRGKGNEKISGSTLGTLRRLVPHGYVFSECGQNVSAAHKTLSRYFPVKIVRSRGVSILVMEGSERAAMEALLKRLKLRSFSWRTLSGIRDAFGIKSVKRNNKIRERFLK